MIIALAIPKGGAGKTTIAATIWAAFSRSLGIDLDIQGNFTLIAGGNDSGPRNAYDVLTGKCSAPDAVQTLAAGDLIASTAELSTIANLPALALRDALQPIKKKYKHIILDTPPALNIITLNALCAADVLIIPLQADFLPLQGLKQLEGILTAVKGLNPALKIGGIVFTRYNPRSNLRRQMRAVVTDFAAKMGTKVFDATIRDAVAVPESQAEGKAIFDYAPRARVTADCRAFIDELTEVLNNG